MQKDVPHTVRPHIVGDCPRRAVMRSPRQSREAHRISRGGCPETPGACAGGGADERCVWWCVAPVSRPKTRNHRSSPKERSSRRFATWSSRKALTSSPPARRSSAILIKSSIKAAISSRLKVMDRPGSSTAAGSSRRSYRRVGCLLSETPEHHQAAQLAAIVRCVPR